jgi:hypothetical protein
MRLIKMLGLAAIAAGVFMAFLGASSASATSLEEVVLCKALESPCKAGHYGSGTKLHITAMDPEILGDAFNLLCTSTKATLELTSSLAHGQMVSQSFSNCAEEECVLVTKNLPYLAKVELQADDKSYEALITSSGAGRPSWQIECSEGFTCSYSAITFLYEVSHFAGLTLLKILQPLTGEGSGSSEVDCYPAMDTKSSLEDPFGPLSEVVLCKALEDPCTNGNFGTGSVFHAASADPKLLGSPELLCTSTNASGELTGSLAHGQITSLASSKCELEGEESECTWTWLNLPYLIRFELQSNHVNYEALVTGTGSARPSWRFECPSGVVCAFGASVLLYEVSDSGGVTVLKILQSLSGEGLCFSFSGVWHQQYAVKCLDGGVEVNCYPAMEPESNA